jgi:trans-aconitate methyltransferase
MAKTPVPNGTYRWNAAEYARHSSAQLNWARELIDKLDLQGQESVLDLGCGDGKVTAEIADRLPQGQVVGLDSSEAMIQLATHQFPPNRHPNLSFQWGDAAQLNFSAQFDIVFSNAALHWIQDHRPVLAGIRKSLKPKGRILLQMGGQGNAADIVAVVEELMHRQQWSSFFEGFEFPYGFHGSAEYRQWLIQNGLIPLRVALIPKDMTYPDQTGLEGWLSTTWLPYTQRIEETLRPAFIRAIADTYIARHPLDREGQCHVRMIRLEVEAQTG